MNPQRPQLLLRAQPVERRRCWSISPRWWPGARARGVEGRIPLAGPGGPVQAVLVRGLDDAELAARLGSLAAFLGRRIRPTQSATRLHPGSLRAQRFGAAPKDWELVRAGDVLCCGCPSDTERRPRCPLSWWADLLGRCGWDCVVAGRAVVAA